MNLKYFAVIVVCLLTVSCSTIRVANDYGYDFSKLKTFNWIPNPDVKKRSELTVKHFKTIMEQRLSAKGIVINEDNPDFFIAYHSNVERRTDITNWGYGYSPWYGRSGLEVYTYDEGTAVVDFVEANSKELIYRSSLSAEVNRYKDAKKRMERIEEAVDKILENFPPKVKK